MKIRSSISFLELEIVTHLGLIWVCRRSIGGTVTTKILHTHYARRTIRCSWFVSMVAFNLHSPIWVWFGFEILHCMTQDPRFGASIPLEELGSFKNSAHESGGLKFFLKRDRKSKWNPRGRAVGALSLRVKEAISWKFQADCPIKGQHIAERRPKVHSWLLSVSQNLCIFFNYFFFRKIKFKSYLFSLECLKKFIYYFKC